MMRSFLSASMLIPALTLGCSQAENAQETARAEASAVRVSFTLADDGTDVSQYFELGFYDRSVFERLEPDAASGLYTLKPETTYDFSASTIALSDATTQYLVSESYVTGSEVVDINHQIDKALLKISHPVPLPETLEVYAFEEDQFQGIQGGFNENGEAAIFVTPGDIRIRYETDDQDYDMIRINAPESSVYNIDINTQP
ncbi:MAG: hypothetical protein AAGH90_09745 [Pseudomonadota bacterium]